MEDIIQEISILSELHSPYVTQYHGSYLKGSDLWIVMEFCSGGSCGDLMKPGLIAEDYISIIIRELLLGLDYLHGDKKLHRDIKGKGPTPKIMKLQRVDFGGSCECLIGFQWTSEVGRFWCLRTTISDDDQKEHFRGYSILDGA